jgi:hypothetical protein
MRSRSQKAGLGGNTRSGQAVGAPHKWRSTGGNWPACETSSGGMTQWGSGPNLAGSIGLGPQHLLLEVLAKSAMMGLMAHRCNPMEWTKLAVAVDDVGQASKVEDLAQSKSAGYDGELTREANTAVWGGATCSGDKVGGSSHHRAKIILDVAPYLTHQRSWGQNHGKHCCSSRC